MAQGTNKLNTSQLAQTIGERLKKENASLSTAESCTGGNIAHQITLVSGASAYFKGSVVSYCNEIKHSVLGVPLRVLETQGAVSEETVINMCSGAIKLMNTDYALSISGLAGPNGDGTNTEVGTVWICAMNKEGKYKTQMHRILLPREEFISRATHCALLLLLELIG